MRIRFDKFVNHWQKLSLVVSFYIGTGRRQSESVLSQVMFFPFSVCVSSCIDLFPFLPSVCLPLILFFPVFPHWIFFSLFGLFFCLPFCGSLLDPHLQSPFCLLVSFFLFHYKLAVGPDFIVQANIFIPLSLFFPANP